MVDKNNSNENNSAPYIVFGSRIYMRREARGIRTEEMAACIRKSVEEYKKAGMKEDAIKEQVEKDIKEYQQIERGKRLPNDDELQKMTKPLDWTLATLKDLRLQAKRKIGTEEPNEISGAVTLSHDLEKNWKEVKEVYKRETGHELTHAQLALFGSLKKELYRVFVPPPLPFDTLIILDTIKREEKRVRYLNEITDFVCKGEGFPGYLARHYLGGYFCYTANLFFFQDNPSPNILHCMNRLEILQFKELFAMVLYDSGIYTVEQDLPILQKKGDYTTMATMFAMECRPILPKEVNPDHLEMAVALQGCGENVLYTCLQSLLVVDEEHVTGDKVFDETLFKIVRYQLHAEIAGGCAANFRCPWEVIEALQTHHDLPVDSVTPLCAALKMVNFFTNILLDPEWWAIIAKNTIEDYMKRYPQLKMIPAEDILKVFQKMYQKKELFFEKSSTIVASSSKKTQIYLEKMQDSEKRPLPNMEEVSDRKKKDIRLDLSFQKSLCMPAMEYVNNLIKEITSPGKSEKMADFLERIKLFHLRRAYAKRKDIQVLAHDFEMSEDEIRNILKISL